MSSPNFLSSLIREPLSVRIAVLSGGLAALWVLLFTAKPIVGVLILLIGLYFFFSTHLRFGLYLLVAVGFFHGWEIIFGQYPWAKDIPFLPSVNAPVGDLLALLLLVALVPALCMQLTSWPKVRRIFPGFAWYAAFVCSAFVSLSVMFDHNLGTGAYHIVRWIIFSYAAFVCIPCAIIGEKETLERIIRIMVWVGVGTSLFGLLSIILVPHHGEWFWVVPYAIHGIAPFGYNHNLIAEPLVAIYPLALYVWLTAKHPAEKQWYGCGVVLIFLTALLTFSRAAWIGIMLQSSLALAWYSTPLKAWVKAHWRTVLPLTVVLSMVALYMGFFLTSSVVRSSTSWRIDATKIVGFYTLRSPLFGYGPGSYLDVFGQTGLFRLEYGDPLDAHGFMQKVLLEQGLVGLVCFVGFLGWVLWQLWQTRKNAHGVIYDMMFLSVLGAIVFQLFNTSYFNANMWLPIGIALAARNLYRYGIQEKSDNR